MSHQVEIAPSILAADFACLGDGIRAVEKGGATLLHVDVMDGHFVPNISIGVPVVASLRKATRLPLDVHLMIENPEVLGTLDHVLVMSVNPGFGGQKFIPGALEKIRQLKQARERYNLNFRIEVDGGVGPENVADLVRSGAEILVAGTSIFHTQDPAEAVRALKQLAGGALAQRA